MCSLGLRISCYYWVLCATCWTRGTDWCLMHCCFLWWAGSSQVCGRPWCSCVCSGWRRSGSAPLHFCDKVLCSRERCRSVLCVLCSSQLLCGARGQSGEAEPLLSTYRAGRWGFCARGKLRIWCAPCSVTLLASAVAFILLTQWIFFHWAVSKGLTDINESYQHSRGVLSQPCRQKMRQGR